VFGRTTITLGIGPRSSFCLYRRESGMLTCGIDMQVLCTGLRNFNQNYVYYTLYTRYMHRLIMSVVI